MSSDPKTTPKADPVLLDAEFNKKWDALADYQTVRKSNDPRFGEITILKHKQLNELIFSKEKWTTSKPQAITDIKDLKSRLELNNSGIQILIGWSSATDKQLCSTNYLTVGYYQFPKSDLNKEILDGIKNKTGFFGDELNGIANDTLDGLRVLHSHNIVHGDIRPLHIGYDKLSRDVRFLDRLKDSSPLEKVQGNNIQQKKDLYLSPQLYAKLTGKDKTVKYNNFKNDSYALGLSLLYAGNQQGVQDIYEPNGVFNQEKLDAHVNQFDNKFRYQSPNLVNRVKHLLHPNEEERLEPASFNNPNRPYTSKNVFVSSTFSPDGTYTSTYTTPGTFGMNYDQGRTDGKLVSVVTSEGTTYSYLARTGPSNNVIFNYDTNNLVYLNNQSSVEGQNVVYANPTYTSYAPKTEYGVSPDSNSYVYGTTNSTINTGSRSNSYEVRRGSSIPVSSENKSVVRKYVMQGDKLIEITEPVEVQAKVSEPIHLDVEAIKKESEVEKKESVEEKKESEVEERESVEEKKESENTGAELVEEEVAVAE